MSTTTKYQTDFKVIKRSQLKNAPYNPRFINDKALARIKGNIKTRKLMGGIVWNEATGNLVSGHQRLKALDALEKNQDYNIRVEVVSLTDKEEKEQNVFMNSSTVQGEFDLDIMKDLLSEIDYKAAGLDEVDLNIIGVEIERETEQINNTINDIIETQRPFEEKKAAIKEAKKQYKEKLNSEWEGEPYFTVTFDNYKNKAAFMNRAGFSEDERFIKGEVLSKMIEFI